MHQSKYRSLRPVSRYAATIIFMFLLTCSLAASVKQVTVDCGGQTQGAFSAIQPAINSLDVTGPNQVLIVSGHPCSGNVNIADRQRLTITGTNGTAAVTSAAGPNGDTFTIQGSTAIFLSNLDVSGGNRGIAIGRNSEVTIDSSSVHDNAGDGVSITDSLVNMTNSQLSNNGGNGVTLTRSRGSFQNMTVTGNFDGFSFFNGSSGQFTAPNSIQNNFVIGVDVENASSLQMFGVPANPPQANVISGNGFAGLGIFSGHVALFNNNTISSNGSGDPFSAGVRVDDNSTLLGFGSAGNIQITDNNGTGIDATAGGDVDVAGSVITNNTGDGIRGLGHVHVVFFPPNSNTMSGNGGRSITCDESSVFVGDHTGVTGVYCAQSPIGSADRMKHKRMHDAERYKQR